MRAQHVATAYSRAPVHTAQVRTTQGKSDDPSGSEAASALRTTSDCAISCLEAAPLSRRITCSGRRTIALDVQRLKKKGTSCRRCSSAAGSAAP